MAAGQESERPGECPNCGRGVEGADRLCPHCGFDLRSQAAPEVREARLRRASGDQPDPEPPAAA